MGNQKAVLETDQDPAIVAMQREVVARLPGLVAENSVIPHSAASGMLEKASVA